jgi:hypothetical protein
MEVSIFYQKEDCHRRCDKVYVRGKNKGLVCSKKPRRFLKMTDLELEKEDKKCSAHAKKQILEKEDKNCSVPEQILEKEDKKCSAPEQILEKPPKKCSAPAKKQILPKPVPVEPEIFVHKYSDFPGGSKQALDFFRQAISSTPPMCPLLTKIPEKKTTLPTARLVSALISFTVQNYEGGMVFEGIVKAATKDEFARVFAVTQTSKWWCLVVRSLEHIYSSLYHYSVNEKDVEQYFAESFENYIYMNGSMFNDLECLVEKIKNGDREWWLGYANKADLQTSNEILEQLSEACDQEELSAYIFAVGVAKGCDSGISNYCEILLSLKEEFHPSEKLDLDYSLIEDRYRTMVQSELANPPISEVDEVFRQIPNPWVSTFSMKELYPVLLRSYSVYKPNVKISPIDIVSRACVYNFVKSLGFSFSPMVIDSIALAFAKVPIFNRPRTSRYPVLPYARTEIEMARRMHRSMSDVDGFPITLSNGLKTFTRHEFFAFLKLSTAAATQWFHTPTCSAYLLIPYIEKCAGVFSKETPKPNYDKINRKFDNPPLILPPQKPMKLLDFNPLPGMLVQRGVSSENIKIFMSTKNG